METIKQTIQSVQNAISGDSTKHHDGVGHDGVGHDEVAAQHPQQQHHPHDHSGQHTATVGNAEPTPSLPAADQSSRTTAGGAHDAVTRTDSASTGSGGSGHNGLSNDLEKTLSGPRDPAVQGEEHPKMTGEGVPGSHSALFGLTPDGKKA